MARSSNRTPSGRPMLNAGASRRSKKPRSAVASASPIARLMAVRFAAAESVIVVVPCSSRCRQPFWLGKPVAADCGRNGRSGSVPSDRVSVRSPDHRVWKVPVLVDPLVGVRAEEVALALDQRGGQPLGAQPVVVGQGGGEARRRDAGLRRAGDHAPPRVLGAGDRIGEVRRQQQRGREVAGAGRDVVGLGDPVQELRPDDAPAAPDPRHRTEIDVPAVLRGAGDDLVETLRVRDDLRRIQRDPDVLDEGVPILRRSTSRSARAACRAPPPAAPSTTRARGRTPPRRSRTPGCPDPARSARSRCRCPSCRRRRAPRPRTACRSRRRPAASTSAVISIRNESRSPLFHSREDVADLRRRRDPAPRRSRS